MQVGEQGPSNRTILIVAGVVAAAVFTYGTLSDRSARHVSAQARAAVKQAPAWRPTSPTALRKRSSKQRSPELARLRTDLARFRASLDGIAKNGGKQRARALAETASFLRLDADARITFVAAAPAVLDEVRAASRKRLRVTKALGSLRVDEPTLRKYLVAASLRYERDLAAALKRLDPFLDRGSKRHAVFRLRLALWAERLATFA